MSQHDPVGHCPECRSLITRSGRLIEYDAPEHSTSIAECGSCHSVITPDPIRIPSLDPE